MKKLVIIMMSLVWLSSVACSKKGSSSVATPPVTYSWSGNICKDNSGNTVDNSLCPSNGGSGGYYIGSDNCCYNSSNQKVDFSYCTGQTSVCNGGGLYWGIETVWDWSQFKYVDKTYGVYCHDNYMGLGFNNCSGFWLVPNATGNPNTDLQSGNWKYCK